MSAFVTPRVLATGTTRDSSPRSPTSDTGATNVSDRLAAARPAPKNIGCERTGWGVGIEALASPIGAHAIAPPFRTSRGRIAKYAGSHSTRSASLPTSTDPTSEEMPCAIAGQIVYLAT